MAAVAMMQLVEKPKVGLTAVCAVILLAIASNPALWKGRRPVVPSRPPALRNVGEGRSSRLLARKGVVLTVGFLIASTMFSPPNPRLLRQEDDSVFDGRRAVTATNEIGEPNWIPPRTRSPQTSLSNQEWRTPTALGGHVASPELACVHARQVFLTRGDATLESSPSTFTDRTGSWSIQGLSDTGSFRISIPTKTVTTKSGQVVYCDSIHSSLVVAQRPSTPTGTPPSAAPARIIIAQATPPPIIPTPTPQATQPPVGRPDSFHSPYCDPIHGNVLANDYDPDGDDIIAVYPTRNVSGLTWGGTDGSFTYMPPQRICDPEDEHSMTTSFSYKVQDANGKRTQYIKVTLYVSNI